MADWFVEKEHVIRPELEKQNTLRKKWLTSGTVEDKHTYLKQKSAIQRMLWKIKNHRYQMKATEIECAMRGSGNAWKSIRQLQEANRGLRPTISKCVKDETGELCMTQADCHNRWKGHFRQVLNIESEFDMTAVKSVQQRPLHADLDSPPTKEELDEALHALKCGKIGGENDLLPEQVKRVVVVFEEYILELFTEVWHSGIVPTDWVNAILVAILKKGDLSQCDNWHGISLLDVTGKLVCSHLATAIAERG